MQCQIGFRDNIWKSSRLSELLSQLGCRGYFHPPGKCPINSILYLKRAIAHARASIRATGLICVESTTHYFNFWHFTIVFFVIWTRCSQMKINNYLLILIPHLKLPVFVGNKAKGRMSKRVFQENKARQIFRKTNISYLLIRTRTCAYQEVRNVRFSENLACFVFLKHLFWDSPFCLITEF